MKKVYITDKQGNEVLPKTHVSAVYDDEGNDLGSHLGAFEDEVRGLVDTPHQEYVTVATYASLPASGSEDTIYRVSNYDGSQSQVAADVYSEYAWDGTQYVFLCVKSAVGEVFDISAYHNNATYADLNAALTSNTGGVPQSLQKGGMSIKYVQSSDNKYVQYRLMSDTFNTTPANWQGVDDEPTAGSDNLVKSGGVYTKTSELENETYRNTQFVSKTGYPAYTRDYKGSIFRFYDLTKTLNIEIKSLGRIYSIFYARQISHSHADFDFIVNSTSNDYKGSISVKEGYPYIGIWDENLQDDNIIVREDNGIIVDIEEYLNKYLNNIYSDAETTYKVYGDFRYYNIESRPLSISIKGTNNANKRYSIFYSKTMPYGSLENIEYIVREVYDDFNETVTPKEGYPYIGIWDENLQNSDITVNTISIIDELIDKVDKNTEDIDNIYSDEQSPYEISGNFRYYNIESKPLSISIKGSNDADKIYSIFYSKTMPYGSLENIEYIVREVYDDFNETVTPKEGYPYIGIWIKNLQDSDITVNTSSIIDELIDKVDKNTEDIDNIKNSLVHNRLYPSQLKSEMIKKVCQEMSIPIIDQNGMSGITTFNADLYLSDGTHPNGIGKEKSATLIASKIKQMLDVSNIDTPKMASVGDSITSNQVTNTADAVRQKINAVYLQERESDGSVNAGNVTTEFGNVACGWSTLTDYWVDGENKTTLRLLKSPNVNAQEEEYAYNVLSNQILRLAQHTTALGEQIIINATDGTNFTVPTEIGVGKGYIDDIPDVIYIASSTNDRWTREIIQKDDWEEVKTQKYNELKRDTIPSALRWAIISLQSLYPNAYIFVCTPLQKKYETRIVE